MPLRAREIYAEALNKFRLGPTAEELIQHVMAGDDRGRNLEESLRSDAFFTRHVLVAASERLKKGEVKDLSHAVVLLGPEATRDFVFGHTIYRSVDREADGKFEGFEKSATWAPRTKQLGEFAAKIKYESVGSALALGLVFDFLEKKLTSQIDLEAQFSPWIEKAWNHSLRVASIAWGFANHERIQVKLKKMVFPAGFLHDIGRIFLASLRPKDYLALQSKLEEGRGSSPDDDTYEVAIEKERFGLSHCELGSWLVHHTRFLMDYEMLVDYHHDFAVLKTRNPDQFVVALLVHIADRVSFLLENKTQYEIRDLEKILDPHKNNFPLGAVDLNNLVMGLRSRGFVP